MLVNRTKNMLLSAAIAATILAQGVFPAAAANAASVVSTAPAAFDTSEYKQYLNEKFDIDFPDSITRGQFIQAVAKVLDPAKPDTAPAFTDLEAASPYYDAAASLYAQGVLTSSSVETDKPLSAAAALFIAVKAAGLTELAYTYPDAKTENALKKLNLSASNLSKSAGQELAAAVDSGLLPAELYSSISGQNASSSLAETLLVNILSIKGDYKHYIGRVSDSDIYAKLLDAYNTADLIEAPELQDIVDNALKEGLVTGYNLKDDRYDAGFTDSLSLTYGHDDSKHAVQLIGLLRSEGIDAKVQLEPKTSAFIYMKEWGEPPASTDSYKVVQIENGNYIAYAKEYDLAFEFNNAADKDRFQAIILSYAKRDSDDETGLIAAAWWQPLYYSLTELEDYQPITNNKIVGQGHYYAQSFSLTEQSPSIVAGFKKLGEDKGLQVVSYPFWVDQPFYNYLQGEAS